VSTPEAAGALVRSLKRNLLGIIAARFYRKDVLTIPKSKASEHLIKPTLTVLIFYTPGSKDP